MQEVDEQELISKIPKTDIILLGYGIQGRAIAHYILNYTDYSLVTVDIEQPLDAPRQWEGRWVHMVDAWQHERWHHAVQEKKTVVISCMPTEWNLEVAASCRLAGANYIDLGGETEVAEELFDLYQDYTDKGLVAVPDCGIAPGLVSSLAGSLHRQGQQYINIYCGGIPVDPTFPDLGYLIAFSPQGVIKEYTGSVPFRERGAECVCPALDESKRVLKVVPGLGVLEGMPTSGSMSVANDTIPCTELTYHTLRYAGHWDYVKDNILTQPNPAEVLEQMSDELSSTFPDLIILGFATRAMDDDIETEQWFRWDYDHDNNIGAMAQITGYTVAAVACMILEQKIVPGVLDMAELEFSELRERISKAPNQFRTPQHDLPGRTT